MKTQAKTRPKNPEKKKIKKGVNAISPEEKPEELDPGIPQARSVFLEIIFREPGESPDATVIAWTVHQEGLRGQPLGGDRRALAREALEILHAHAHASAERISRIEEEIVRGLSFQERVGAMMKLHKARMLDRKRQLEEPPRAPLDFEDLEALGRKKEEV